MFHLPVLLSLAFYSLPESQNPIYWNVQKTEILVAGPAQFRSEPTLQIEMGYLWIQTKSQEFSFQARSPHSIRVGPQSFVGCQILRTSQKCDVIRGSIQIGSQKIEDGNTWDLIESKATPFEVLSDIVVQNGAIQISWSTAPTAPKNFRVAVSRTPTLRNPAYLNVLKDRSTSAPLSPFQTHFVSVEAFARTTGRRVRSPLLPTTFQAPFVSLDPPARSIGVIDRTSPLVVACQLKVDAPAVQVTVLRDQETVFSAKVTQCPFTLPSLKTGSYVFKVNQHYLSSFWTRGFSEPKLKKLTRDHRLLHWVSTAGPVFLDVELKDGKRTQSFRRWRSPIQLPENLSDQAQIRGRVGLALDEPVYSDWVTESHQ